MARCPQGNQTHLHHLCGLALKMNTPLETKDTPGSLQRVGWGHAERPWRQSRSEEQTCRTRGRAQATAGMESSEPAFPLGWDVSWPLDLRTLGATEDISSLPELCLQRGRVHPHAREGEAPYLLLCPVKEDPHLFHPPSQALGPSSGQERGEATGGRPCLSLSRSLSSIHSEHQEAEEDRHPHQGDSSWCREELAVINTEVPDHTQQHHKHRHHEAAYTDTEAGWFAG